MKHMKKQRNMAHLKRPDKSLETDLKEIQSSDVRKTKNNHLKYAQGDKREHTIKLNQDYNIWTKWEYQHRNYKTTKQVLEMKI